MVLAKKDQEIKIHYDLRQLPTVQHRAGLGALVFLLESLKRDQKLPAQAYEAGDTTLDLNLTKESLFTLLDHLYSDVEVTRTMNNKPKGEDFQEVKLTLADGKVITKYAYQDRRPAGGWLSRCGYGEEWLTLWQDSIWFTLRAKPASRIIYTGSVVKLVSDFWKAFDNVDKGKEVALELAGALYIGGRSKSNEEISFDGPPSQVLLLHFAHALAQPFRMIGLDSQGKRTYPGLVWVYPEPRDLIYFEKVMRAYLGGRQETVEEGVARVNFRSSTRVSMPQEAGLAVLEMALSSTKTEPFAGVFCAQLDKQGNNVNLLAVAHIAADRKLIQQYAKLVAPITNYALKKMVLGNLLKGAPLNRGAAKLMSRLPSESTTAGSKDGGAFSRNSQQLLANLKP